MKQSDGIAYEKPELLKYSLFGIVNGADGSSGGGDVGDDTMGCDEFIDE